MKSGQHVWLVKYALTDGVTEEVVKSTSADKYVFLECNSWNIYTVDRDVFADYGDALKAAETKRKKKLDSLRKQIAKLEKLKF